MKKILFLLCFLPLALFGQHVNMYVTGGHSAIMGSVNLNFEYRLTSTGSHAGLYSKMTIGNLWTNDILCFSKEGCTESSQYLGAGVVWLAGKSDEVFELGLGVAHNLSNVEQPFYFLDWSTVPTLSVGYRYQTEKAIVRLGVGFVEGAYLSLGVRL